VDIFDPVFSIDDQGPVACRSAFLVQYPDINRGQEGVCADRCRLEAEAEGCAGNMELSGAPVLGAAERRDPPGVRADLVPTLPTRVSVFRWRRAFLRLYDCKTTENPKPDDDNK
jgi:hypothetical protein